MQTQPIRSSNFDKLQLNQANKRFNADVAMTMYFIIIFHRQFHNIPILVFIFQCLKPKLLYNKWFFITFEAMEIYETINRNIIFVCTKIFTLFFSFSLFQVGFKGFGLSPEKLAAEGIFLYEGKDYKLKHGSVVIAAITSCTNTSNPSVMLGAGKFIFFSGHFSLPHRTLFFTFPFLNISHFADLYIYSCLS